MCKPKLFQRLKQFANSLPTLRKDESGETLAFLFIWPIFFITAFLFFLHVFLINTARAELEIAASKGLRAAWGWVSEQKANNLFNPAMPQERNGVEHRAACAALAYMGPLGDFSSIGSSGDLGNFDGSGNLRSTIPEGGQCVDWAAEKHLIEDEPLWLSVLEPQATAAVDERTGAISVLVSGRTVGPLASWWPAFIGAVSAEACGPLPVAEDGNSASSGGAVELCAS